MTMPNPLELPARVVVDVVKASSRRRLLMSCIGLVVILVAAFLYVAIGGLRINPARTMMTVHVMLPESGGLLANQDVTVRGIPVGRVQSIDLTEDGVMAVAAINSDVQIPADSPVRVSGLSIAGEQYLDFRPESGNGPFLADGATIARGQTAIPLTLSKIIDESRGALAQMDTEKIKAMFAELRVRPEAADKLAAIFDGTIFLTSTLQGVLPQTTSLLRNTRVVATTLTDVNPGLRQTSTNLQEILHGVNVMDGGFRTLADRGAGQMAVLDNLIADNRENMVQLLGNLTTVAQVMYLRIPALQNLWRPDHGSLIDRLSTVIHDGGVWGIADIWPKYRCDYDLPRRAPTQADFPEPFRHTYCKNPDPSVLIRGARNAPRPPGEEGGAGPPPGHDPLATTDPSPNYPPYTLQTPFAGPELPAWIPE